MIKTTTQFKMNELPMTHPAPAVPTASNSSDARKRRLDIMRQGKDISGVMKPTQPVLPARKKRKTPSEDALPYPEFVLSETDCSPPKADAVLPSSSGPVPPPTLPPPAVGTTLPGGAGSKPLACLSGTSIPLIMIKARVTKRPAKGATKKPEGTSSSKSRRGVVQIRYDPDVPMSKEEAAEWRREQRRVRNRESAAASRQKTRDRISELEGVVAGIQAKYEAALIRLRKYEPDATFQNLSDPVGRCNSVSPTSAPLACLPDDSANLSSAEDSIGIEMSSSSSSSAGLSGVSPEATCISPTNLSGCILPASVSDLHGPLPNTISVPSSPIGPPKEYTEESDLLPDGVVSDVESIDEAVGNALNEKISRLAWSELQFT